MLLLLLSPVLSSFASPPTEPMSLQAVPAMGMTVEMPVSTPELEEALHRDRESLMREADVAGALRRLRRAS